MVQHNSPVVWSQNSVSPWSWNFISDVHVKSPGDSCEELLLSFLKKSREERYCEKVFLCGDIFDFMVGDYDEYRATYSKSFKAMRDVLEAGKDLYFIEGNHDFNIQEVLKIELGKLDQYPGQFYFSTDFFILSKNKIKFFICHGDTIEIESGIYPIYKTFATSQFVKLFLKNIVSYKILEKIGRAISKKSRDRGIKAYGQLHDEVFIKDKFRRSALSLSEKIEFNVLVCGHSHVKDNIKLTEHIHYINNGYAPISRTYIQIDQTGATFQPLN